VPLPPRLCACEIAGNNNKTERQSSFFMTSPSREPDARWLLIVRPR
jgi:hypothetical protein